MKKPIDYDTLDAMIKIMRTLHGADEMRKWLTAYIKQEELMDGARWLARKTLEETDQ